MANPLSKIQHKRRNSLDEHYTEDYTTKPISDRNTLGNHDTRYLETDIDADLDQEHEPEVPECTVMLWEQFVYQPEALHDLFYKMNTRYDIIDLTSIQMDRKAAEFEVRSSDDIDKLTNYLLGRSILFRASVKHEKNTSVGKSNSRTVWEDELAVLINTSHPNIRGTIRANLEKGAQVMNEGKKFCLKLSFGGSIRNWYARKVVGTRGSYTGYYTSVDDESRHLSIYIHNCSSPVGFYMSPWTIGCCLPCWLFSCGLCYYIHRKTKVTEINEKLNVKITAHRTSLSVGEDTPSCGCGSIYHMKEWQCVSP